MIKGTSFGIINVTTPKIPPKLQEQKIPVEKLSEEDIQFLLDIYKYF